MQICYCEDCGLRIAEADITAGNAQRLGDGEFRCPTCVAARAPQPPPAPVKSPARTTSHKPPVTAPAPAPVAHSPSKPRMRPADEGARPDRTLLYASVGGGGAAVLGLLLLFMGRGTPPPAKDRSTPETIATPAPKPDPAPPKTEPPPKDDAPGGGLFATLRPADGKTGDASPRDALAQRELQEVKRFGREHPDDQWEYRDMLTDLASRWRSTPAGAEAAKLLGELKLPAVRRIDKPLAHWTFDERDGTAAQDAAGGSHGGLKGQVARVAGKVGAGAVSFSGNPDDYVDLGSGAALNFAAGAPFTIAGWVKTSAPYGTIVSLRSETDEGTVLDICTGFDGGGDNAGCLMALVRQDGDGRNQHAHIVGAQVNTDAWRHFALTRSRQGLIRLFLDGTPQGSSSAAQGGGALTSNLRAAGAERLWVLKNTNPAERRGFAGQLDDLRVYGCALSDTEIRDLALGK
jgi:hypothetical protein